MSEAYWSLLNSILYSSLEASRSNRVWLPPLLTRYSISPMIVSFLNAIKNSKVVSFQPLLQHFAQCMYIIWPIVTTRQNLDSLSECFNAVLSYSSTFLESGELKLDRFSLLVVRSFRQSFGNSSAKKKVSIARFPIFEPALSVTIFRHSRLLYKTTFLIGSISSLLRPLLAVTMKNYYNPNFNKSALTYSSLLMS